MDKSFLKLSEYLSYCLIAIIFFLISQSSMDMWDGVVASYASETGNHGGSRISLFAAGWYLQYFIYKGLFWLESSIGISFFTLSTLISFVFTVLLAREIFLFSNKVLRLEYYYSVCVLYFFVAFPVWQIFFSSIHLIFIICTLLCFLGVRLAYTPQSMLIKSLSFVIITLSFQLNSMLVLGPCLGYAYQLAGNNSQTKFWLPNKSTLFIFFLSTLTYLFLKVLFPSPAVLSYGYNSIINPLSSSENFLIILGAIKSYATFFIILFAPILVLFTINIFFRKNYVYDFSIYIKKNYLPFFIISILTAASMFSYIMVGKASVLSFDGIAGWGMRHSIVLATIFPMLLIMIFKAISLGAQTTKLSSFFLGLTLLLSFSFLTLGIASKINRLQFQDDLILLLKKEQLKPGIVYFVFSDLSELPDPVLREYELNYTFYKVFEDKIDTLIFFVQENNILIQDKNLTSKEFILLNNPAESINIQLAKVYEPSLKPLQCKSLVAIKVSNFEGISNMMANSIGFRRGGIDLELQSSRCSIANK
jgi:hypothetical protein